MKEIEVRVKDSSLIQYGVEVAKQKIKDEIFKILNDEKFINHVSKRLTNAIMGIAIEQTSNIGSDVLSSEEVGDYLRGFDCEIRDNTIIIFNSSVIDTSTKNISPQRRMNYPLQLSLSKLVEYGFGYTGWLNTQIIPENWEYDVNQHGYRGWYYEDKNGNVHWTNGMEGRLVFLRLCWWLQENFKEIVYKYLKNNL